MSRQKKVKIFLVVIVVLYLLSTSYGLSRDDGKMGQAMAKVNEKVEAARRDIKKEMDKPFILRIFGSLFSMEGNSLEKLKRDLPKTLKSAMPSALEGMTRTAPPSPVACVGMRLADALLDLQTNQVDIEQISWSLDEEVEEGYLKLGGTVISALQSEAGGARLTIQYLHPWNGEEGLGSSESERRERLQEVREQAREARRGSLELYDWLIDEDLGKIRQAAAEGFPIEAWCDVAILHEDEVPADRHREPAR